MDITPRGLPRKSASSPMLYHWLLLLMRFLHMVMKEAQRAGRKDVAHAVAASLTNLTKVVPCPSKKQNTQTVLRRRKHPRILLSSMKAREIYDYLMTDGYNEKMCYLTAVYDKETNTYVPIDILKPKMDVQSPVFVSGERHSILHTLSALDPYAHKMVLQCHKHPGRGIGSTFPSGTDIRNHRDLEMLYPVIGAIFVRDGHFRFFTVRKPFRVDIYGEGVKRIDRQSFHLTI